MFYKLLTIYSNRYIIKMIKNYFLNFVLNNMKFIINNSINNIDKISKRNKILFENNFLKFLSE
jgi:hypothetical protein